MAIEHIRIISHDKEELNKIIQIISSKGANMEKVHVHSTSRKDLRKEKFLSKEIIKNMWQGGIVAAALTTLVYLLLYFFTSNNYPLSILFFIPFVIIGVVGFVTIISNQFSFLEEEKRTVINKNNLQETELLVDLDFDSTQRNIIMDTLHEVSVKSAA